MKEFGMNGAGGCYKALPLCVIGIDKGDLYT